MRRVWSSIRLLAIDITEETEVRHLSDSLVCIEWLANNRTMRMNNRSVQFNPFFDWVVEGT